MVLGICGYSGMMVVMIMLAAVRVVVVISCNLFNRIFVVVSEVLVVVGV